MGCGGRGEVVAAFPRRRRLEWQFLYLPVCQTCTILYTVAFPGFQSIYGGEGEKRDLGKQRAAWALVLLRERATLFANLPSLKRVS